MKKITYKFLIYMNIAILITGLFNIYFGKIQSINSENFAFTYILCIIPITLLFYAVFKSKVFKGFLKEEPEYEIRLRKISDDLTFMIYIFGFLFIGLPYTLSNIDNNLNYYYSRYIFFFIASLFYFVISKGEQMVAIIHLDDEQEKEHAFLNLGDFKDYMNILIFSFILFLGVFFFSLILPMETGFFSKEGRRFILFMTFASIPAEEIVFRGLMYYWLQKVFAKLAGVEKSENVNLSLLTHFSAILISSIAFGIFHITAYGLDLPTIIYLTCVGFICGLGMFRYGLLAAYIIHLANNLGASKSALTSVYPVLFGNPSIYILAGIFLLLITASLYLSKKIKLNKGKKSES